jgi:HSP20 family protein
MTEEMDRLFGDGPSTRNEEVRAWVPTIEVTNRDGNYVVRAELPGIKPDDVKIEVTDEAIVLQGERKDEREEDKGGVHVSERRYGRFYRVIPVPEGAKVDQANAKFDNGVLEIAVPVEEKGSNTRQIPIQSSSQGSSGSSEKAA